MQILLSNDDGFHAPGILALKEEFIKENKILICAPSSERSGTSHGFSLHDPLRLEEIETDHYSCSGYPADCTFLALSTLYTSAPDLVISGINRGGNLAQDIYYSGTIAAAREATLRGVSSIAVSICTEFSEANESNVYYEDCAKYLNELIKNGLTQFIKNETLLNINFPNLAYKDIKGVKLTELGRRNYSNEVEKRKDPRGSNYWWNKATFLGTLDIPNSDCNAVSDGYVSISNLNVFPSGSEELSKLREFIAQL